MLFKTNPDTGEMYNSERARSAELALDQFGMVMYGGRTFTMLKQEGTDQDSDAYTCVQDLITNLLHVADQQGWDTKKIVERAVNMFEDECAMEEGA